MSGVTKHAFVTMTLALLGVSLGSSAFAGLTIERTVRCDFGKTVQDVLDRNILGLPMDIKLVGACPGFELTQDAVVIRPADEGLCPGATITGTVFMIGARRIELRCLEIASEDGPGIDAQRSTALLEDVELRGNDGAGLESTDYSRMEMSGGSVADNSDVGVIVDSKGSATFEATYIGGNAEGGIQVVENSRVVVESGQIEHNDGSGVRAEGLSGVHIFGTTISDNRFSGIQLRSGSRGDITDTVIANNGGSGLVILENSTAGLFGGSITGNGRSGIYLSWHSVMRSFWGTIIEDNAEDGLKITRDSGVQLGSGTSIPPNGSGLAILCVGEESSIEYQDGVDVDLAFVDCEDPDF